MAILDKDRPRGLRVPSLASFRSKHKSPEQTQTPTIQLPSPSQLSLQADSIPVSSFQPVNKALPPQPQPSPPQPTSPAAVNPYASPPQAYQAYNGQPSPAPAQSRSPNGTVRNEAPLPPPPADRPSPRPIPPHTTQTTRRPIARSTTAPAPAPASATAPTQASTPMPAPVPVKPVAPAVVQQRTPPSSEGEPEQRHSNGSSDSLDGIIPDPLPEPALDGAAITPNEAGSSEDDDRPFTPPEVEPVAVPLNKLHYSCYQDHRAMPATTNVWYSLPCMACQKFDREVRHRCVFCCLRVCAECFQSLKKYPRRSLAQLMETLPAAEEAENQQAVTVI